MTAAHFIGIPLALIGAVLMTFAASLQHRGVSKVNAESTGDGSSGLGAKAIVSLLRRPSWLIGTLLIALAVCCQLGALLFAPLIMVQPIGVVSLVLSALLTSRQTHTPITGPKRVAVALSVLGVAGFVVAASFYAKESPVTDQQIITTLIVLGVVVVGLIVGYLFVRGKSAQGLFYVVAGGMLYGFMVTLMKIVLSGIQHQDFTPLTIMCAVGVVIALLVGGWFVQTAYGSGPPDLVVAGLTVIDPLVAVSIGILVLGEADGAPMIANVIFLVTGAIAVTGVVLLQRAQRQQNDADAATAAAVEAGGDATNEGEKDPSEVAARAPEISASSD